jgi:hypothetical protein
MTTTYNAFLFGCGQIEGSTDTGSMLAQAIRWNGETMGLRMTRRMLLQGGSIQCSRMPSFGESNLKVVSDAPALWVGLFNIAVRLPFCNLFRQPLTGLDVTYLIATSLFGVRHGIRITSTVQFRGMTLRSACRIPSCTPAHSVVHWKRAVLSTSKARA